MAADQNRILHHRGDRLVVGERAPGVLLGVDRLALAHQSLRRDAQLRDDRSELCGIRGRLQILDDLKRHPAGLEQCESRTRFAAARVVIGRPSDGLASKRLGTSSSCDSMRESCIRPGMARACYC